MSNKPNVPSACDFTELMGKLCGSEPFFGEHEGKRYCVLHFPAADKKEDFDLAIKRKLESKDSNYQGVWFPVGNWFSGLVVENPIDFSFAVFHDRASFYGTTFKSKANFKSTTFNDDAAFRHSTFAGSVDFSSATFQKRADFSSATFKEYVNFWRCTFNGSADFHYAVFLHTASFWPTIFNSTASFSNATFANGNFGGSEFSDKAVFSWCRFTFASFVGASFSAGAEFFSATFEELANFAGATFDAGVNLRFGEFSSEARFISTRLNGEADFSHTVFKDIVSFSAEHDRGGFGANVACDFRHARFEKPKRVSFHSLTLRPHWFVNVDMREFEFIDVRWIGLLRRDFIKIEVRDLRKRDELEERKASDSIARRLRDAELYRDEFEIERLKRDEAEAACAEPKKPNQKRSRFNRLLSITCRQLAINAEENYRFDEASDFRFWSMELRHKEGWKGSGRLSMGVLHTFYRYLSGYGEEVGRALWMLFGIWLFFAVVYMQVGFVRPQCSAPQAAICVGDELGTPQKAIKAATYSLAVMTLQRPDPRPLTATAWFAVLAETIVGPLQAALLALAIRRRFMR